MSKTLFRVFSEFKVAERPAAIHAYGSGHIHSTFLVETIGGSRYILQKINRRVFPDLNALESNLLEVTHHIANKQKQQHPEDWERRVLRPVPTNRDNWTYLAPNTGAWRAFHFIPGARTFETVQSPAQAFALGRAAGIFQNMFSDFEGSLQETIPGFHDTRRRFQDFRQAVQMTQAKRLEEAQEEIEFANAREDITDHLAGFQAAGRLPVRITHNDTKINNVLFDEHSGEALCLIDLDTVMPGLSLYDFGDMVRTGCPTTPEHAGDPVDIRVDPDRFAALAQGYLAAAGPFLTNLERSLLVFSGRLLTYETGLRFLTDFLQGDVYFRTEYSQQNLVRCRNQFRLLSQMERQAGHLESLARQAWERIIS